MRELKALGIEVPDIEEPQRFFPDPVLVRAPQSRPRDDGQWEIHVEAVDRWVRVHPICIDVLRGLEVGLGFDGIVARLPEYPDDNIKGKAGGKIARRFLWNLHKLGYARFDLEEPPDLFNGRYERVKELGRGGLGVAHLCRDLEDNGREVVVKHPWGIKAKIDHGQAALAVEIHLLQRLDHPALPRLVDQFQVRGLLHMVRDFVDGRKVSAAKELRADRALRLGVARQVAGALAHIQDAGFLFFDPSPDNFFLTADGRVILTDLGGCRPLEGGAVRLRGMRGTPGYVAPEIRRRTRKGNVATKPSDVWSFGCFYYALVAGQRPRRLWREEEIRADLETRGDAVHPDDRELIEACCKDDPAARPADLAAVRALLG